MNAKPASLQTFTLTELEQYTKEGQYSTDASKDFHLFKAQNNTLAVFTDPDTIARFTAELIAEHLVAVDQGGRLGAKKTASQPGPSRPTPKPRSAVRRK